MQGSIECQDVEEFGRQRKQWCPAEHRTERAVGDDTGESSGDDDLGLEIGRTVKNLGGEQRSCQRCPEDGRNARPHARRHEDAPLSRAQAECITQERAEARPNLGNRSLSPTRTARADGQGTGNDLHQRNPWTNLALGDGDKRRWRHRCRVLRLPGPIVNTRKPLSNPPTTGTTRSSHGRKAPCVSPSSGGSPPGVGGW